MESSVLDDYRLFVKEVNDPQAAAILAAGQAISNAIATAPDDWLPVLERAAGLVRLES